MIIFSVFLTLNKDQSPHLRGAAHLPTAAFYRLGKFSACCVTVHLSTETRLLSGLIRPTGSLCLCSRQSIPTSKYNCCLFKKQLKVSDINLKHCIFTLAVYSTILIIYQILLDIYWTHYWINDYNTF